MPDTPASGDTSTPSRHGRRVVAVLGASACALAVAPALMPASYSFVAHGTSDSAAQGVPWAWVTRLGFLLFGIGVLWLAALARPRWGGWGAFLLGLFGACMVMAAMFSTRPWVDGAPYSAREDLLHSVAATTMGVAFTAGVLVVAVHRGRRGLPVRALDLVAIVAATALPLAMSLVDGAYGALQRPMFVVAYLWYGREALALRELGTSAAARAES